MLRRALQPPIPTFQQVAAGLMVFLAVGGSQAALFERSVDNLQREAEAAHAEGKQLAVVLTLPDCPGCLEMEKNRLS
jgi:putative intracellular protease/amidase